MSELDKSTDEYAQMQVERLKQWAKKNYVLPQHRSSGWHPIVLAEMARRDAENQLVREKAQAWDELQAKLQAIVPLMPDQNFHIHQMHKELPAPKFATQPKTVQSDQKENEGFVETGWY